MNEGTLLLCLCVPAAVGVLALGEIGDQAQQRQAESACRYEEQPQRVLLMLCSLLALPHLCLLPCTQVAGLPGVPILYVAAGGDHSLVAVQRAGPGELVSIGQSVVVVGAGDGGTAAAGSSGGVLQTAPSWQGSKGYICWQSSRGVGQLGHSALRWPCHPPHQCMYLPPADTAAFHCAAGPSHARPHGESTLPLPLPSLQQLIEGAAAAAAASKAGRGSEAERAARLGELSQGVEIVFSCPTFLEYTMSGKVRWLISCPQVGAARKEGVPAASQAAGHGGGGRARSRAGVQGGWAAGAPIAQSTNSQVTWRPAHRTVPTVGRSPGWWGRRSRSAWRQMTQRTAPPPLPRGLRPAGRQTMAGCAVAFVVETLSVLCGGSWLPFCSRPPLVCVCHASQQGGVLRVH